MKKKVRLWYKSELGKQLHTIFINFVGPFQYFVFHKKGSFLDYVLQYSDFVYLLTMFPWYNTGERNTSITTLLYDCMNSSIL